MPLQPSDCTSLQLSQNAPELPALKVALTLAPSQSFRANELHVHLFGALGYRKSWLFHLSACQLSLQSSGDEIAPHVMSIVLAPAFRETRSEWQRGRFALEESRK